ncbi:MAG: hypothetical protein RL272_822 [Candidatus Parcubacteria bacterium]
MDEPSATLTSTEYEAFNRLFDAIQRVLGSEEHRIVDPHGKVEPVFGCEEAAGAFVRKLVALGLIEFIFAGAANGGERRRETYRAHQGRWLDAADRIRRVPDPPFKTEDRMLRDAIARQRQRRQELVERRAALVREIADVDARIAEADRMIEEAERVRSDIANLRDRVGVICNDAA